MVSLSVKNQQKSNQNSIQHVASLGRPLHGVDWGGHEPPWIGTPHDLSDATGFLGLHFHFSLTRWAARP